MKKYLLTLSLILFFFLSLSKAHAQDTLSNGANTKPINFPAGSCVYTWANNNTSIGLAASGTGNIPSFTAINTGSSPVTATITGTPVGSGFAYIVNSGSNSVSVINTATSAVVATIPVGSNPNSVCVDPNYNEVYVVNNSSNTVSVINTLTNTIKATISVGPSPWSVTVSQDGSRAYVADGGNNDVEVINTTTNTVMVTIPAGTNPNALAVSPNGSLIYVNNSNSVTVINTSTNAVVATIPVGSAPQAILITPDGSKVYEANYASNNVYVINTATNTVAGIIPVGVNPGGGSMSPDGSLVYIANEGSNSVSVISTATNAVINTIPVGASPWGVSVRPDGTQIYVANSGSNTISVVNASTNAIISTISVGSRPYSFGSFFTGGMGCSTVVKFTITVEPTSALPPTITATTATGTISACAGTASASPQIQQFTVSGSGLTGSITATAPAGFEVSLASGSGYASSITIPQTSGTVSNTVVYVRSTAAAPTGRLSGNVTLTSAGASSQTVAVTGTVNALPTVKAVSNQTANNGAATAAINFTGTGNAAFNWVNDTPGIGLPAAGSGNISSFKAVNNGTSPVTATITVTPVSEGFAYIANGGMGNISVINVATNMVVATITPKGDPFAVCISPDGSRAYVGCAGGSNTIAVINTQTNQIVNTITVNTNGENTGITISPDGATLYVADYQLNNISVVNIATSAVVAVIPVGQYPYAIAISPDGSNVYVAFTYSNYVSVISTATKTVTTNITVGMAPRDIAVSRDGSKVYVPVSNTKNIAVIDPTTNSVIAEIPTGANPGVIALSPGGTMAYVSTGSNFVSVINTTTKAIIATITIDSYPNAICVSPDGHFVYVTNSGTNSVSVINTSTNTVIATVKVGTTPISLGNFVTSGTGCAGTPTQFTITVNPTTPPTIVPGAVTGTISACQGTASASPNIQQFTVSGHSLTSNIVAAAPAGFELSLAAGSGYNNSLTLIQTSGSVSSTVVYVRSSASLPNGTTTANVLLSSPGATDQTVSVTGIINPMVASSLIISASGNKICVGNPVTFTASPTNGGNTPVYQWLLNGNNVGTNNATFTSDTFANGDVVSCVMTSNTLCVVPANAISNSITINITSSVTPSISIAASENNVCAGTPVTFTASHTNGGAAPNYQWLLNGSNAGTNSATFTSTFANGDVVSCVMTGNAGCAIPASIASNSIVTNIFPLPVVNGGGNKTIEKGNSITLTATASGNIADITWSPLTGLDNNKILNPKASPASTTLYTIAVQTAAGCIGIDSVMVTVFDGISIPNTFTPNGDGVNDKWDIQNLNDYQNCVVRVFDRYGAEVYSSKGYYNPWDGTRNGQRLPIGTYYYVINLNNDTRPLSGFVLLIR
ncbi:MAG: hypothetical protein JWP44_3497 [Mucilaginibacter sp.]|nr:hypothetical protein [Mucilaginibacter sp.]